jgi:hypothetical protein
MHGQDCNDHLVKLGRFPTNAERWTVGIGSYGNMTTARLWELTLGTRQRFEVLSSPGTPVLEASGSSISGSRE